MEKTVIEYLEELKIKNEKSVGATRRLNIIERNFKELQETVNKYKNIEKLCEKVIEKPIYEKYTDTNEIHREDYTECCALYNFKYNRIELYMYDFVNMLEIDQYGKTWALTKEELESK